MKNIFLLPTDKPSRLVKIYNEVDLKSFILKLDVKVNDNYKEYQNIYMTSTKEIKMDDWYLDDTNSVRQAITECESYWTHRKKYQKIILTTDVDLIKDGVQYIDDEFLEWFVKNPSCEEVEVKSYYKVKSGTIQEHKKGVAGYEYYEYKIIIPQEEPKQETLSTYLQVCKECGSEEVARCKWVNVNTEEIYSADSGTTLEWCFDCKSETNIIDKEDYEK